MNFSALTLTRKALHPFSRWPGKKRGRFCKIMDLFPPHTFPALHYGWKWIAFGKGFKTDASNWNVPIPGWLTRFPSWPLWKRLKNAFCLFYCNRLTVQIDSFKKVADIAQLASARSASDTPRFECRTWQNFFFARPFKGQQVGVTSFFNEAVNAFETIQHCWKD